MFRFNLHNILLKGKNLKIVLISLTFIFISHSVFDFIDLIIIDDDPANISLIDGFETENSDQENESSESEEEIDEVDDFYDLHLHHTDVKNLSSILYNLKKINFSSFILEIDSPPPIF